MTENRSSATASVNAKMGLIGWLTLVFVILKLDPGGHLTSPVVDWPWWLVFSPILLMWAIIFAVLGVITLGALAVGIVDWVSTRKRKKEQKTIQSMTPQERRDYFASKRKR